MPTRRRARTTSSSASRSTPTPGSGEFRARHPLTTCGHYQPYVARVAGGEQQVLDEERETQLAATSGTSSMGRAILPNTPAMGATFFHARHSSSWSSSTRSCGHALLLLLVTMALLLLILLLLLLLRGAARC